MAALPQLSENMSAAQFAEQANTNFSTVMNTAENAGSSSGGGGETSDIQRTIKMQMQGGKLVNGYPIQYTVAGNPLIVESNFFNYCHTTLMLNVENCSLVSVGVESGETLTIFCYAGNGSYTTSVSSVSAIPATTCFVRFMVSKSSAYDGARMLTITIKGVPKFYKNDSPNRQEYLYLQFETQIPASLEATSGEAGTRTGSTDSFAKHFIGKNERVYDNGYIMLPPNYSIEGAPVPLVLYVHGTNGLNFSGFSSANYKELKQFILNNGYAIADCSGITNYYYTNFGVNGESFGAPSMLSCLRNLVKFVTENYNVCTDGVYAYGKSAGGFNLMMMCSAQGINVKAIGGLAPAISALFSAPLHCNGNEGTVDMTADQIGIDLGIRSMTKNNGESDLDFAKRKVTAVKTAFDGNVKKWRQIDSFFSGMDLTDEQVQAIVDAGFNQKLAETRGPNYVCAAINLIDGNNGIGTTEITINGTTTTVGAVLNSAKRWIKIPTTIWVAADDTAVSYYNCKYFVEMAQRVGSPCHLRSMTQETGAHHSVDTHSNAPKVDYKTKYAGVVNVPIAYAELVDWFNRW